VRLAEGDGELVVRADGTDPRAVVVTLFILGYQLAGRHHDVRRHVRPLVEELGGREHQHAVVLGDEQKAVRAETGARLGEGDRRGEALHLVGGAVLGAIGDRPQVGLAGADEDHSAGRPDCHMAGIGHYSVEVNAKPFGQLDAFEVLADGIGGGAVLGNGLHVQGLAGGLHRAHALQGFVTGRRRDGSGAAQRKQGAQGQAEGLHGTHLGAPPQGAVILLLWRSRRRAAHRACG